MTMIKFRAKRTDNGEMVEGYYIKLAECSSDGESETGRYIHFIVDPENLCFGPEPDGYYDTFALCPILPDTIEQKIGGEWMKPEVVEKLQAENDEYSRRILGHMKGEDVESRCTECERKFWHLDDEPIFCPYCGQVKHRRNGGRP